MAFLMHNPLPHLAFAFVVVSAILLITGKGTKWTFEMWKGCRFESLLMGGITDFRTLLIFHRILGCVILAGAIFFYVAGLLIVPKVSEYKDRIATDSTARAVCAAIHAEISRGTMPDFETLDNPAEYDHFFMQLARHYDLDAPRGVAEGKPLLDRWGQRFQIRLKDNAEYFEVVSAGPDKRFGSEDDIRAEAPLRRRAE